jgi:hypothetical protein
MPRKVTTLALLGALALAAPAAAPAADTGAGPEATASKSCSLAGKTRSLGPTYTTSLSVRNTSCRSGRRLVRGWNACRRANGGADGRCRSRVLGYRCSESRSNVIRTQFDARVSCRKGSRRINHRYTQFT